MLCSIFGLGTKTSRPNRTPHLRQEALMGGILYQTTARALFAPTSLSQPANEKRRQDTLQYVARLHPIGEFGKVTLVFPHTLPRS